MLKIIFAALLLSLFNVTELFSQGMIFQGVVLDSNTKEAVPFTNLYIDGTTFSTTADVFGKFKLTGFPNTPFKLIISRLGYNSKTIEINSQSRSFLEINIEVKFIELNELVVKKYTKRGWLKYGNTFLKSFIGSSAFAKKCKILNPEVLQFDFDSLRNQLTVRSNDAIIIENKALGYQLKYQLNLFIKNYSNGYTYFEGLTFFRDLSNNEKNKRKVEQWMVNRKNSYNGSIQHFLSSLYKNNSFESGFRLKHFNRINIAEYKDNLTIYKDTASSYSDINQKYLFELINSKIPIESNKYLNSKLKLIQNNILEWKNGLYKSEFIEFSIRYADTTKNLKIIVHEFKSSIPIIQFYLEDVNIFKYGDFILLPDPKIIAENDIYKTENNYSKKLDFGGYLEITYIYEKEEAEYLGNSYRSSKDLKFQVSKISINDETSVIFYSDGYFEPINGLNIEEYWGYEKIDKMLPINFIIDK